MALEILWAWLVKGTKIRGELNLFPIKTGVHWKVDKMIIFSYNSSICLFFEAYNTLDFVKIDTTNTHINERHSVGLEYDLLIKTRKFQSIKLNRMCVILL